jgi:hypothetical protein
MALIEMGRSPDTNSAETCVALASNRDFGPIVPIRPQPADLEGVPGTVLLGFQLLAS